MWGCNQSNMLQRMAAQYRSGTYFNARPAGRARWFASQQGFFILFLFFEAREVQAEHHLSNAANQHINIVG